MKNKDLSFSIITPSLNQGSTIKQTIDSVESQCYPYLEHIVVDGNSTDSTLVILKKQQTSLSNLIIEPDNGQSEAINKGLKLANGDIMNWLNADDYYEPEALTVVAKAFENSAANVVAGRSRIFQEDKTVGYTRGTDVYPGNLAKTIGWARIDQPETFFRKQAWDEVGLLNEQLHYTMDREWWMRYLYHFGLEGIVKIKDVVVNFRLHEHSKTVSSKAKFHIEHDTIFYILSTVLRDNETENLLRSNLKLDLSIDSRVRLWTNREVVQNSLNYYLLKRAEVLYYQGELGLCRDFIRFINPSSLAIEDRSLLNRIKMRSKLPRSIIALFRKK